MINLSQTRAGFLAEIEGTHRAGEPLGDITDPRIATTNAHVRVCGHERDELFPILNLALLERFATAPWLELIRDLLMPLKHVLGNAYKHGNGTDPSKTISVEMVLTGKGALIAITDEGPGFDVAGTFRRFQEQGTYFENHGAGFRSLHEAKSTVSYENGGRTVLLCFRTAEDTSKLLDAGWLQTCLSAELPEFGNNRARIESCRIYPTHGRAGDACGNRYVLRVAAQNGAPAQTRILTGRLHATAAAAAVDFDAATRLHGAPISKRLRIPRPVARLASEPRLVLYDFDPWMNLWEYLTTRGSLKALRSCARRIGEALATLHRSQVALPGAQTDPFGNGLQAMAARAETTLQPLPSGADLVTRFRLCVQQIEERAAFRRQRTMTPIHGALGWDCIHYGVDNRFYLYCFEACHWSDPGLDLGGFAADLLCYTLANHDDEAYRVCSDDFLSRYNAEAAHPMDEDDLRPYIVLALSKRLQRTELPANVHAGKLLAALNAVLCERATATEVAS